MTYALFERSEFVFCCVFDQYALLGWLQNRGDGGMTHSLFERHDFVLCHVFAVFFQGCLSFLGAQCEILK